jgi:hypothetical protein
MSGPRFMCASELKKKRGVTENLRKRFFDPPDDFAPNPCNKRFPDMRLYELKRVEKIEQTEDYQRAFAKSQKMSVALKAAHARKRERAAGLVPLKPDTYVPYYLREN